MESKAVGLGESEDEDENYKDKEERTWIVPYMDA